MCRRGPTKNAANTEAFRVVGLDAGDNYPVIADFFRTQTSRGPLPPQITVAPVL
jgi:hypothetical protein